MLSNDSIIYGYVKTLISIDGEPEIELWKTIRDKNPTRYKKLSLKEYAIKKDTFRIFHDFETYNGYFVTVEAKRIVGGKVQLYMVDTSPIKWFALYEPSSNYMSEKMLLSIPTLPLNPGDMITVSIPIVKPTDNIRILSNFFDDIFMHHYTAQLGKNKKLKIRKPKDLKELVRYYNTGYKK